MTPTTEHYLVGAALLDESALAVLLDVEVAELNDPALADVLTAMANLVATGAAVDVPSVARQLGRTSSSVGFPEVQELATVAERFGNVELAEQYRDILREQNRGNDRRRFFTVLAQRIAADPEYDYQGDVDAFTRGEQDRDDAGGEWLATLAPTLAADVRSRMAGEAMGSVLATGLPSLDRMLHGGGLHDGELVVMGGRPGSGKTLLAGQIAMNVARHGGPVLFVSAEMTRRSLARRMVLEHTGLPAWVYDARGSVETRWEVARREAVDRIVRELAPLPIYIHDASRPTASVIRQVIRRRGPFRLVIFDYTSLSGDAVRSESEERRMAQIALNLQQIARDCAVPLIALHQLSRAVEVSPPFRPAMAHLRDSGQVEASAHLVWLLYRRQYYVDQKRLKEEPGTEHDLEIDIAKNRDGLTGVATLHFEGSHSRIREKEWQR